MKRAKYYDFSYGKGNVIFYFLFFIKLLLIFLDKMT